MRLATWNVNSVKARLPRLLDWLADKRPDVVCLQETKCAADAFPAAEVAELGYATAAHGDGRWNGVALLSRVGLDAVHRGFDGDPGYAGEAGDPDPAEAEQLFLVPGAEPPGARPNDASAGSGAVAAQPPGTRPNDASAGSSAVAAQPREARTIAATCAGVRVWSVYVPNGRTPESAHYQYKLKWLAALRDAVAVDLAAGPVVVCGDFNVAPTDADVWDPLVFVGSTHVTPPERAAIAALRDTGLRDIVPSPMKGPNPFTYWDYRAGMFHQDKGMRIDLVLASESIAGGVESAYIDREARKGKGPSDHAPVIVEIAGLA
jgi:exodeoxyribonuclease-3